MAFDKLSPVWDHILAFLVPPDPKCLSGWTQEEAVGESDETIEQLPPRGASGTTSRRDIRAGALATLMRTSVAFNQLAGHHLYKDIITDSLAGLLVNTTARPAHPLIESKFQLIERARSLRCEYSLKGDHASYTAIMSRRDNFSSIFASIGNLSPIVTAEHQAVYEAEFLRDTLTRCTNINRPHFFPKLSILSIGAIFGGQDGLFDALAPADETHSSTWSVTRELFMDCRSLMEQFFRRSPIEHYCQRGSAGPLSLPPVVTWFNEVERKPTPTAPHFTFHYGMNGRPLPGVVMAHRNRWVLENRDHHRDLLTVFRPTTAAVRHAQHERRQLLVYLATLAPDFPKTHFDLEIFCSSDRPPADHPDGGLSARQLAHLSVLRLNAEMERKAARSYSKSECPHLEERHDGTPKSCKDNISWSSSLDTPSCQGCGGGLERSVEQGVTVTGPKGRGGSA